VARRLVNAGITIFGIICLNYLLIRLMPGDPSLSIVPRDPKFRGFRDYVIAFFGLDRPQWEQFGIYLQKLFTLDWGTSYQYRRPVADILFHDLGWTLLLVGTSTVITNVKRVRPLQVEAKHIEDAIPSFVREKGAIFTDILTRLQEDFPDEFLILSYLAKRPHSIAEIRALGIEDPRQAMRHLTAYYLVAFDGTKYAVTIKSLVRWLIGGN